MTTTLEELLRSMQPITLAEMSGVKLMNRTDTKFVTTMPRLLQLLQIAQSDYFVQDIDGGRNMLYDTTYFDTLGFEMFQEHQHGHAGRQKIRFRTYVSSNLQFMEIKTKNNHGRTKKKRTQILPAAFQDFRSDPQALLLMEKYSDIPAGQISPVLETVFRRITLVNAAKTERLTIDTRLCLRNHRTGREVSLQDAVIIELKQDGRAKSEMKEILLDHRIKPVRVSKYCIGVTLTDDAVKHNRFKRKIRTIEKTINKKLKTI